MKNKHYSSIMAGVAFIASLAVIAGLYATHRNSKPVDVSSSQADIIVTDELTTAEESSLNESSLKDSSVNSSKPDSSSSKPDDTSSKICNSSNVQNESEIEQTETVYAETNDYRYAVTKQMFEDEQYSIYVIDNTGIKYLKEHYKGDRPWYVAYITAPLMQRFNRMMARQNDIEFAVERIEHDAVEFQRVPWDIQIENADGKYSEAFASLYMFCKQIGVT